MVIGRVIAGYHHHVFATENTTLEPASPLMASVLKKPIPNSELISDGGRKIAVMICIARRD